MRSAVEPVLSLVAALFVLGIALDGWRKLRDPAGFTVWLASGGLLPLARRSLVYLLGGGEVLMAAAAVWPAGRIAAIAAVLLVTPLGAVLVHRTGTCACRGVIRSRTVSQLVVRNCMVALAAAATVVALDTAIQPWAVAACGAAWAALILGQRLLLGTLPAYPVTTSGGRSA